MGSTATCIGTRTGYGAPSGVRKIRGKETNILLDSDAGEVWYSRRVHQEKVIMADKAEVYSLKMMEETNILLIPGI